MQRKQMFITLIFLLITFTCHLLPAIIILMGRTGNNSIPTSLVSYMSIIFIILMIFLYSALEGLFQLLEMGRLCVKTHLMHAWKLSSARSCQRYLSSFCDVILRLDLNDDLLTWFGKVLKLHMDYVMLFCLDSWLAWNHLLYEFEKFNYASLVVYSCCQWHKENEISCFSS